MNPEDALSSYKALQRGVNRVGAWVRATCYLAAIAVLAWHGLWQWAVALLAVYFTAGLGLGMLMGAYALGIRAAAEKKERPSQ